MCEIFYTPKSFGDECYETFKTFLKEFKTRCRGKAQRLARPAAPLADRVQRISCISYCTLTPSTKCHNIKLNSVDKANKLVATAMRHLSFSAAVLPTMQI